MVKVELGVVIGSTAKDVTTRNAMQFVAGYVLALDMTARTFQVCQLSILL
jgi:acylpyruvate hydrolase